ncbi:hypothetical protein RRG08_041939 [Elysia crispata]|uniref:Uncharacterized protein n=1 Tax=Elysia crispata TaxID=231223 RepID=A0AAE1CNX8_9GAST|nr:hypothetical protein RRG08_041939 [Elysia crispata]
MEVTLGADYPVKNKSLILENLIPIFIILHQAVTMAGTRRCRDNVGVSESAAGVRLIVPSHTPPNHGAARGICVEIMVYVAQTVGANKPHLHAAASLENGLVCSLIYDVEDGERRLKACNVSREGLVVPPLVSARHWPQ